MDQVNLKISDNVCKAMDYAFEEAQQRIVSMNQGYDPFTVTVVDEGIEINDHPAETSEAVRESVKMLLMQDMPEGYAFCYDGWIDTDDGHYDAVIVEVADRGAENAFALALIYSLVDGEYIFETDYGYAGPVPSLYPGGTKPIKSGLVLLEEEGLAETDADRTDMLSAEEELEDELNEELEDELDEETDEELVDELDKELEDEEDFPKQ